MIRPSRLRLLAPLTGGALLLAFLGYAVWAFLGGSSAQTLTYVDAAAPAAPAAPSASVGTAPAAAPAAGAAAAPGTVSSGVPTPDEAWVQRTGTRAGIPAPAMRAYARAQLARPQGCALGWTTLAGIGWTESQHGTLGGRTLGDDGKSSAAIVGPALSGGLDHAYGPMQFIPSTWSRWASDGDGDGLADIDDLDDAAMTAMRYLCGTGDALTTGSGWAQAIFPYNHSQTYVDQVYAAANAYAQRTR